MAAQEEFAALGKDGECAAPTGLAGFWLGVATNMALLRSWDEVSAALDLRSEISDLREVCRFPIDCQSAGSHVSNAFPTCRGKHDITGTKHAERPADWKSAIRQIENLRYGVAGGVSLIHLEILSRSWGAWKMMGKEQKNE